MTTLWMSTGSSEDKYDNPYLVTGYVIYSTVYMSHHYVCMYYGLKPNKLVHIGKDE